MEQRYFTVKQLSLYTGLSAKTIYYWAEQGSIPCIKHGKKLLFDKGDIDAHFEAKKRPAIRIGEQAERAAAEILADAVVSGISSDRGEPKIIRNPSNNPTTETEACYNGIQHNQRLSDGKEAKNV